jgi:DNA (cytosine-5)-methyltransferase 1
MPVFSAILPLYFKRKAHMKNYPTLISLFAGAGGLDIGLEQAGFTTLVVNELGPHACETLRQNKALSNLSNNQFEEWFTSQISKQRCYSKSSLDEVQELRNRLNNSSGKRSFLQKAKIIEGDIRLITSLDLLAAAKVKPSELTLVAGGPPCQPFSRAGKRETVESEDGRLFLEFVRVVRDTQPRWFMFENVKGLAQSKTVVHYLHCCHCKKTSVVPFIHRKPLLSDEISKVQCPHCEKSSSEIEVKEVRGGSLEIILNEFQAIGYRCHHTILNAADFGVPQMRERLFIVGSRDGEPFEWPAPLYCDKKRMNPVGRSVSNQLPLLPEIKAPLLPWKTVKDALWKFGHPMFGQLDYSKARIWVKNVVRPHAEPVTWTLDRPSPTIGAHQGAKLALAPLGVPEEQLARQQWHTKGNRQRDLPHVYVEHAMLSDEDLLRLQTFPPDWYLFGTRMERAFQIGNAVPPLLATAVGKAILEACNIRKSQKQEEPVCEELA